MGLLVYPPVAYRRPSKPVHPHVRVGVVQLAAVWQLDGEEIVVRVHFIGEHQPSPVQLHPTTVFHCLPGRGLHGVPELHDSGICIAPPISDIYQLILWCIFWQMSGSDQCGGTPGVAQGQSGRLTILAQGILRVPLLDPLHRNPVKLGCRSLVDLPVGAEHLQHPLLPGKPGHYPGLYGGEVDVNQGAPRGGHERRADELGQGVRHRAEHHPQPGSILALHQIPGQGE